MYGFESDEFGLEVQLCLLIVLILKPDLIYISFSALRLGRKIVNPSNSLNHSQKIGITAIIII